MNVSPDSRLMMANAPTTDEGPRGTVVIVAVFGGLVVLGWLLLFFALFVPRGTH